MYRLQACSSEVMMLRCSRKYDIKTDSIVYANNQPYTRENYRSASIGEAADLIFNFCRSMCLLKVDNAEYSLLTAIVIFSGGYWLFMSHVHKTNDTCPQCKNREATVTSTIKSREDPGVLSGHPSSLCWEPPTPAQMLFCKTLGSPDRTEVSGEHEFRSVLQPQGSKQETATIPGRNMGHPRIVTILVHSALSTWYIRLFTIIFTIGIVAWLVYYHPSCCHPFCLYVEWSFSSS